MTAPRPKPVIFLGDSRERMAAFPPNARHQAGVELLTVQFGFEPSDWRPMTTIGPGVREIRVRDERGAYRVIYLASLADRVLVLHAFQKKTQRTAQRDIDLATRRLGQWRTSDGS